MGFPRSHRPSCVTVGSNYPPHVLGRRWRLFIASAFGVCPTHEHWWAPLREHRPLSPRGSAFSFDGSDVGSLPSHGDLLGEVPRSDSEVIAVPSRFRD